MAIEARAWFGVACGAFLLSGCVKAPPVITTQPLSTDAEVGAPATFSVTATSEDLLTYQWRRDGADLVGATSSSYTLPSPQFADAGASFTAVVSNAAGSITSSPATLSVHQTLPEADSRAYLTAGQIALADLEPGLADTTDFTASVLDGPTIDMKLGSDGILRFLSPAEQFHDTTTTIALTHRSGFSQYRLPLPWTSRIGPSLNVISEADENGQSIEQTAILTVSGVDEAGTLNSGTTSLKYTLTGAATIDPEECFITLSSASGSDRVTDWFDIDAAAGTITLQSSRVAALIEKIRSTRVASMSFSLSTANSLQTYGFEHGLRYANGSITVKLLKANGTADTSLAGSSFVVSGFNTGVKKLAHVGTDGSFKVEHLPSDSYTVEQVLLDAGISLIGFAQLSSPDATAVLQIVRGPGTAVKATTVETDIRDSGAHHRRAAPPRASSPASFSRKTLPKAEGDWYSRGQRSTRNDASRVLHPCRNEPPRNHGSSKNGRISERDHLQRHLAI